MEIIIVRELQVLRNNVETVGMRNFVCELQGESNMISEQQSLSS